MDTPTTIDLNQLIAEREAVIQRLQNEIRERAVEVERYVGELRLLMTMRDGGYAVAKNGAADAQAAGDDAGASVASLAC